MDGEGNEVRRLVDDRRAGRRREAPLPLGRPRRRRRARAGRRLPDAGGAPRRGPRDRLDEADPGRPRAAARWRIVSADPGVIAPGEPGQSPEVTIRYRGPANQAPEFRVFRTDDDGKPQVVRRFRGDGPQRRLARRGGDRAAGDRAGARRRLRLHGQRARQGRQPGGGARRDPDAPRSRRPGTGVSVRSFTLRGPLGVVPAGSVATLEVGPDRPQLRLRALAPRRSRSRCAAASASAGASGCGIPSDAKTGLYLAPGARRAPPRASGRSRWPGCRSRSAPPRARGRWWCCPRSPGRG